MQNVGLIILCVTKTVAVNIVCIRITGDTNLLITITCHEVSVFCREFLRIRTHRKRCSTSV